MPHDIALITTIAAGLGLAFLLGLAAVRVNLPPLVGYLLAGIIVGPFTPGYVADSGLAGQLAEIGVILLMFGVGLHFSVRDLLAVRNIALPGAVVQIGVATVLGTLMTHWWGWSWGTGIVFGLCLSTASTVVLLKALEERNLVETIDGRIAIGWLIVEDIAMVLALVLLPALTVPLGGEAPAQISGTGTLWLDILITLGKVSAFIAVMLFAGKRAVPWLLARVARTGSRELFTLAVLAAALGIAYGAYALFGVSFALGAFFAGMVISESDLSHQAAADALPLQDAFAVLFFVSVGMLFDPSVIVDQPIRVLGVVLTIIFGKSIAAFVIVLLFRYPVKTALTVSASLAQIGEFAFILVGLGVSLGLASPEANSLVLAGALLSITLNPFVFNLIGPTDRWIRRRPKLLGFLERGSNGASSITVPTDDTSLRDHVVMIGYGRVGKVIGDAMTRNGISYVVVERDRMSVESLQKRGVPAIFGDAARPGILGHAHLDTARLLIVATPGAYQAREVIDYAKHVNPGIDTVVRTHSAGEERYFDQLGVGGTIMGERELALGMVHYALRSMGKTDDDVDITIHAIRDEARAAAQAR